MAEVFIDQKMVAVGREVLQKFHNASHSYSGYNLAFNDLLAFYGRKTPFLLEGLGNTMKFTNLDMAKASEAMAKLANKAQGQIPSNWLSYNSALTAKASNPSFWDSMVYTTSKTAKDVAKGVHSGGQSILDQLKFAKYSVPALAVLLAVLYVKGKS